jgi:uncharacterized protein involved in type VI secretion and phage assembly
MKVTTPLGADKLLLVDMEASEGISELFKLTLHMQSEDNALVAANIIGPKWNDEPQYFPEYQQRHT